MPKIIDKEEKKSEIFDAAMRAFAKKGAAGTKIQDIAEEAGVGKGTIYLYFKNKEEIFQSILHQKVSSGGDLAQKALEEPGEPEEKLKALFSKLAGDIENLDYPPEIQLEIDRVNKNSDYLFEERNRLLANKTNGANTISSFVSFILTACSYAFLYISTVSDS